MEELAKLKHLLSIEDNSEDIVLTIMLEDAENEVLNFTNRDELLPRMNKVVRDLAIIYYERYKNNVSANISSVGQGDISVSYETDIPESILKQLRQFKLLKSVQLRRRVNS